MEIHRKTGIPRQTLDDRQKKIWRKHADFSGISDRSLDWQGERG
jgi:hypothetical protein